MQSATPAHALSGIAATDFSRIRQAKLDRLTIDRPMGVLSGLEQEVGVTFKAHSWPGTV